MRFLSALSYVVLLQACLEQHVQSFEIPNVLKGRFATDMSSLVRPKVRSTAVVDRTKAELLEAISFTSNGKDASSETQEYVLNLVRTLETEAPVSDTLLTDPQEAKALDGVWYLQYTTASDVGSSDTNQWKPENMSEIEEKLARRKAENKGTVTAQGITVDTSNRKTLQIFNIPEQRVTNTVEQDFGTVRVSGVFRASETVPTRAVVGFDECEIKLTNGFVLNLGFVFAALALVRGTKDSGWLETTYLDDDMRIGRGNRGSMFILTRDRNAVQP